MAYFYTKPLAALWMAKHFGMRFQGPVLSESSIGPYTSSKYEEAANSGPYIIHQDSLKILEPQLGDLVWTRESRFVPGNVGFVDADDENEMINPDFGTFESLFDSIPLSEAKIGVTEVLNRDGLIFMWPESDDV